jgi:hypothetical protein
VWEKALKYCSLAGFEPMILCACHATNETKQNKLGRQIVNAEIYERKYAPSSVL